MKKIDQKPTQELSSKERQLLKSCYHPVIYISRMPTNEFKMPGIDEETKKNLIAAALVAMERAYFPYSKFPVGAALLTEDGSIITGGNVENASYGGTICAERSAIVRAIAEGHRKFKGIVVATNSLKPASPCGICRQFLFEFGDFPVILISGKSDEVTTTSVKDLLPGGFGPQSLADFAAEGNV